MLTISPDETQHMGLTWRRMGGDNQLREGPARGGVQLFGGPWTEAGENPSRGGSVLRDDSGCGAGITLHWRSCRE